MNELYRNVNEKTFLITGATGFVGSMLCKYILRANLFYNKSALSLYSIQFWFT